MNLFFEYLVLSVFTILPIILIIEIVKTWRLVKEMRNLYQRITGNNDYPEGK